MTFLELHELNLKSYNEDKRSILQQEITLREKTEQSNFNQEILKRAKEANEIAKKSKRSSYCANFIAGIAFLLSLYIFYKNSK
ncbi:MAG: hypothetical protein LCH30_10800 [Proteobacteria bacterium]|nr:hypothetical protein [Pseudomonadota bacterium]